MGWQIARICYGFLIVWGAAVVIHGLWRQAAEPADTADLPPPVSGHH
jgi:hypothetical protein